MATHVFQMLEGAFEDFGVVGASLRQCPVQNKFTNLKLSTVRLWIQSRSSHLTSYNILVRTASVAGILRKHTQHFRSRDIGLSCFRRHATTLGRASWNTQFDSDSSLGCLVDKPRGRFVTWLFLPSGMGLVRLLRTIVT